MTAIPVPDGRLAGYRLVRKLAIGSRADVFLGVGSTGSVALKLFAPSTPRKSIGAELEALGRLDSPHLVRLLDVSGEADTHPVLILERVERGSVAALLSGRAELETGEAVTILAPLASLVAQLHRAGVGHGKLGAASVHLDSVGRPVLLGLGHCALFDPDGTMAAIDTNPDAAEDRNALAKLALGVLGHVRAGVGCDRVRELAQWIESAPRQCEFPQELEDRLFACAEPMAIAFSTDRLDAAAVPLRIAPDAEAAAQGLPSAPDVGKPRSRVPGWLPAALLDNPIDQLKLRAITVVRGVRPRFWVVAGGATLALVLAIALVPEGQGASTAADRATAAPVAKATRTPTAIPSDPVPAAKVLLRARTTCFRDLSILCLDDVDEASSGAFTSDTALIQRIQAGGEVPRPAVADGAALALVERLGDTALISLGNAIDAPSILVIRTRSGWRIRDVLTGTQSTTSP